jgi:hypothetical protein
MKGHDLHRRQSVVRFGLLGGAVAVLLARAYQHVFLGSPFHGFLPEGMAGFTAYFFGAVWSVTAGMMLFQSAQTNGKPWHGPVWAATAGLVLLAVAGTHHKNYVFPQLIEWSAQTLAPWIALGFLRQGWTEKLDRLARLAVSLAFLGHGLYALGHPWPPPASFPDMVQRILGLEGTEARLFLQLAGGLDMLVVIGLWLPFRLLQSLALGYAVVWGLLTSLARPWAYLEAGPLFGESLHAWGWQFVVRAPHFLLPTALSVAPAPSTPSRPGEPHRWRRPA